MARSTKSRAAASKDLFPVSAANKRAGDTTTKPDLPPAPDAATVTRTTTRKVSPRFFKALTERLKEARVGSYSDYPGKLQASDKTAKAEVAALTAAVSKLNPAELVAYIVRHRNETVFSHFEVPTISTKNHKLYTLYSNRIDTEIEKVKNAELYYLAGDVEKAIRLITSAEEFIGPTK